MSLKDKWDKVEENVRKDTTDSGLLLWFITHGISPSPRKLEEGNGNDSSDEIIRTKIKPKNVSKSSKLQAVACDLTSSDAIRKIAGNVTKITSGHATGTTAKSPTKVPPPKRQKTSGIIDIITLDDSTADSAYSHDAERSRHSTDERRVSSSRAGSFKNTLDKSVPKSAPKELRLFQTLSEARGSKEISDVETDSVASSALQKYGFGNSSREGSTTSSQVKRGRGRPRKNAAPKSSNFAERRTSSERGVRNQRNKRAKSTHRKQSTSPSPDRHTPESEEDEPKNLLEDEDMEGNHCDEIVQILSAPSGPPIPEIDSRPPSSVEVEVENPGIIEWRKRQQRLAVRKKDDGIVGTEQSSSSDPDAFTIPFSQLTYNMKNLEGAKSLFDGQMISELELEQIRRHMDDCCPAEKRYEIEIPMD